MSRQRGAVPTNPGYSGTGIFNDPKYKSTTI